MDEPLRLMLWHWGRRGGGPRYTMELARVLARKPSIALHLSLSRQSDFFDETNAIGMPGFHVDTYRNITGFALRSALLPAIGRRFMTYVKRHRIDVVFNTMDFLWGAMLAPGISRTGVLYLLAVHDARRHPGDDGWHRRWLLARDIAAADGAVTLTEAVRDQLIASHSFPVQRTWTAPLGTFLDTGPGEPRELSSDRPIRLLFFGRILPYKGLDIVLKALPLIRRERSDVELEIWGSGDLTPYRKALEQEGVRLQHGWLKESDIPEIFQRTDICVLPYREASQSAVIASALAAGMPVVATPVAGLVEQIGKGRAGRVAPDYSPQGFARTVLELISAPDDYGRLSEAAIRFSRESLAWDAIGDRIEHAARELLALGRRERA